MVTAHERAVKSLWTGRCTVYTRVKHTDPETRRTVQEEATRLEDEPCRISYLSSPPAGDSRGAPALAQSVKLIIGKEADVPPGSRIVVTQNDVTTEYAHAGPAGVYSVHKEINLETWGGWA